MNPPLAFRFAVLRSASAVLMSCSLRELSLGLDAEPDPMGNNPPTPLKGG